MLIDVLLALAVALQGPEAPLTIEDEVLGNVRAQRVGPATIADFAQPEAFQRRYADRVILGWYAERFRAVVADAPDAPDVTASSAAAPASQPDPSSGGASDATLAWIVGAALAGCALVAGLVVRHRSAA